MKKKLTENVRFFVHGVIFSVLANNTSNLLNAIIAFVALETIWLILKMTFKVIVSAKRS